MARLKTVAKVIGGIAFFLFAILAGSLGDKIGRDAVKNFESGYRDGALHEGLKKISDDVNRDLPKIIDRDTRLDTTFISSSPMRLTYSYTLTNHNSKDIDWESTSERKRPLMKETVCHDMKWHIENKVEVAYQFRGKDGVPIGVIVIRPNDCKVTSQ